MTIKWATKLRKGTGKNDRNKFAEKGRSFGSSAWKVQKKKNKSELFTSQKYSQFPFHFYANLWKTSPTTKILYCKCWGETFFTVIAVRTMTGSHVQLIIMHNFGKFQPGMLFLIIWQRHRAICFSLGLTFHCLHTISDICIFWVNIVPTSGSTNHLKIPSQNKILYNKETENS